LSQNNKKNKKHFSRLNFWSIFLCCGTIVGFQYLARWIYPTGIAPLLHFHVLAQKWKT
jgi:hypothetical protein